jgi:hypothetical protein
LTCTILHTGNNEAAAAGHNYLSGTNFAFPADSIREGKITCADLRVSYAST